MQFKLNALTLSAAFAAGFAVFASQPVMANGGHFLVDDADITPPGECMLETWFQRASAGAPQRVDQPNASHSWVAMPICTTQNGWEVSLPVEYNTSDSELAAYGLELKTMLSTNLNGGALALSVGVMRDHQESDFEGGFINLPYSYPVNDALMVHVNVGTEYNNFDSEWNPTWGLATTFTVNERLDLIAETAGVSDDSPAAALGFRTVLNDRIEFDASFGRDFEVRSNIVTIGLNVAF
ncbi:hypothetical protein CWE09_09405 [Aliidiomarina minuta]|uniref:Transporter n=1 Tax=Aliidiomarina minuta TaxID=880057 RepID=A0A432WA79_9GAMM|nr:hypothetical protein [Aliidiomarina minuta]RUO26886.1 hypothetical protein CWE09_09405 [Aliidiomarina minuta]